LHIPPPLQLRLAAVHNFSPSKELFQFPVAGNLYLKSRRI
jgi:hypothetical protein